NSPSASSYRLLPQKIETTKPAPAGRSRLHEPSRCLSQWCLLWAKVPENAMLQNIENLFRQTSDLRVNAPYSPFFFTLLYKELVGIATRKNNREIHRIDKNDQMSFKAVEKLPEPGDNLGKGRGKSSPLA
ncbi:MAG: hypothetical protein AAFZ49_12585, partial [Cyanobacteria bacterium J06659_2]